MRILKCTCCRLMKADTKLNDLVCPAFPDGIPDEIRLDESLHYPDDKPCNPTLNNIHWEQK